MLPSGRCGLVVASIGLLAGLWFWPSLLDKDDLSIRHSLPNRVVLRH